MATASAFGFSGWDPFGSYGEGLMGLHFGKKSAKRDFERSVALARWQALNLPSLEKEGFIKAGFNPLLAVGSIGSQSLPSSFSGWMPHVGSDTVNGFDYSAFASQKAAKSLKQSEVSSAKSSALALAQEAEQSKLNTEILRMERDAQASETSARSAQAFVDELEAEATSKAITGVLPAVYVDGKPTYKTGAMESPQFQRLVQKLENQIERDKYINSKEHAIYEDGINAVHGINYGASAYDHWRSSRRNLSPSSRSSSSRKHYHEHNHYYYKGR